MQPIEVPLCHEKCHSFFRALGHLLTTRVIIISTQAYRLFDTFNHCEYELIRAGKNILFYGRSW